MSLTMENVELTIVASTVGVNGSKVLKISGPMTISNLFEFQDVTRAETATLVVLDLSEVPYMDSAALGSVVNAYVSCANHNRRFALAGVCDRVATLLWATKVDKVLPVYPTVSEALQALDPPAS